MNTLERNFLISRQASYCEVRKEKKNGSVEIKVFPRQLFLTILFLPLSTEMVIKIERANEIHVDIGSRRRTARRIVSQEITIRISSAARSSLSVSGRSRRRIVRGTSTISLLDPFERRGSPFSSPTARQGRSLGRQVKLKTFTPALPPHLLLEPGASSYYACNRLYNCVYGLWSRVNVELA